MVNNLPANAETWVQSLIQEDPSCLGATGPQLLSCALELESHKY